MSVFVFVSGPVSASASALVLESDPVSVSLPRLKS